MWSTIKFGKHAGKTLPQVLLSDADWFYWALEDNVFKGPLVNEAKKLADKARWIRIPKPDPENWRIEYIFMADGKFAGFEIVNPNRPPHQGSMRSDHLDLSVVRQTKRYDKLGHKLLLKTFRYYFFGKENASLTRKRCEEFFNNERNFLPE
jgi:hypothetical protein